MKNLVKRFKTNKVNDYRFSTDAIAHKNKVKEQTRIWREQTTFNFISL